MNYSTVQSRIVNVAAVLSVLSENGKVDALKTGMILYEPFDVRYVSLCGRIGKAWGEGRRFL